MPPNQGLNKAERQSLATVAAMIDLVNSRIESAKTRLERDAAKPTPSQSANLAILSMHQGQIEAFESVKRDLEYVIAETERICQIKS